MAGFWIAVCLMIAAALAFVLPPLLGRYRRAHATHEAANLAIYQEKRAELAADRAAGVLDDAAFAAACAELDRELLRDASAQPQSPHAGVAASPYPAIVIAVLVPLAATGIYLAVGAPALLLEDRTPAANAQTDPPHSLQEMVALLEQRLREQPQDTQGWVMLGRSYAAMNRLDEARAALEQANRQAPDDPMTLVTLAEVRAGQQGERLDGEPIALVRRALALAPDFPRALWLAGVHAFNAGRPDEAGTLWQRLLDTAELSPEAAAQVREAVARTASEAAPAPAAPRAAAPAGAAQVTVQVRLAPELAARLDGSETLFVFARAAQGPRMPLAIVRRTARELPLAVTLDDSMAMSPQLTLSSFDQVVVSARVSRSGDATPVSGDLLGSSAPLAPAPGSAVDVVIDTVVQ